MKTKIFLISLCQINVFFTRLHIYLQNEKEVKVLEDSALSSLRKMNYEAAMEVLSEIHVKGDIKSFVR